MPPRLYGPPRAGPPPEGGMPPRPYGPPCDKKLIDIDDGSLAPSSSSGTPFPSYAFVSVRSSSDCRMQHTWRYLYAAFVQASGVVILPDSSLRTGASPDLLLKSLIMALNFQPAIWSWRKMGRTVWRPRQIAAVPRIPARTLECSHQRLRVRIQFGR
jgi:hypothetical protein